VYETIMDHRFEKGILKLKVKYYNESNGKDNVVEVPFGIMKKDEPVSLAKYIKRYVVESSRRNGTFNVWATKVLKANARAIRRLYRIKEVDKAFRIGGTKVSRRNRQLMRGEVLDTKDCQKEIKRKLSRNARNQKKKIREKFGIKISRNTREALLLDKKNGDSKWAEAICKEMDALERLGVFQYHDARTKFHRHDGWQYAPMHMILISSMISVGRPDLLLEDMSLILLNIQHTPLR